MRRILLSVAVACVACTPQGRPHEPRVPVSWTISSSDSPQGSSTVICESWQSKPCVLERSTPDRPKYSSFVLHLWGPSPTKFTGSFTVEYFDGSESSRYRNTVELTSTAQDVHQRVFSKVTTVPGTYHARIHLDEGGPHLPKPRRHELSVPVTVR